MATAVWTVAGRRRHGGNVRRLRDRRGGGRAGAGGRAGEAAPDVTDAHVAGAGASHVMRTGAMGARAWRCCRRRAADAAALDVIAAQTLARQSGCLECHSVYQKKVGPAWKDVAAKYHSEPRPREKLTQPRDDGPQGQVRRRPRGGPSDRQDERPEAHRQPRRLDPRAARRRARRRQGRRDARAPEPLPQVPHGRPSRRKGRPGRTWPPSTWATSAPRRGSTGT